MFRLHVVSYMLQLPFKHDLFSLNCSYEYLAPTLNTCLKIDTCLKLHAYIYIARLHVWIHSLFRLFKFFDVFALQFQLIFSITCSNHQVHAGANGWVLIIYINERKIISNIGADILLKACTYKKTTLRAPTAISRPVVISFIARSTRCAWYQRCGWSLRF